MEMLKRLVVGEEGADAVEYGLLASLIAIAIIVGAGLVGKQLDLMFKYISAEIVTGA